MRWLLFLSKLAFICNIFFLASFVLQVTNWMQHQVLASYVVIIGWVLGAVFNLAVNLSYLVVFATKRKSLAVVPSWLLGMNIIFLFLQLIFLLIMNVAK